jgi:multisubunit Na+/H+ antiporter MnhB subunit
MLALALFLLCTGLSAWRVATVLALRQPVPLTDCERASWLGILGLALWLAQGWLLAAIGWFRPGALLSASVLLLALVMGTTWSAVPRRSGRWVLASLRSSVSLTVVFALGLVVLWLVYSGAALAVIPVSDHDALSYHFPKAAWLATTGKFGLYASQDLRVTYFPGNDEMLVATLLTFLHSDTSTGWITSAALLLYLSTSFVLFRRTWKDPVTAALALPMLLASPVLLLHTTAHKNDILMSALALNALVWLGRWAVRGESGAGILGVVSVALGLGTKFHGLFLVPVSGFLLWRAWRAGVWRPRAQAVLLQCGFVTAAFVLLGGVQYIANVLSTGKVMGIEQISTPNAMNTVAYPAYGQVPRFIWMFLAAPVLTSGQFFRVPWNGEAWFWPAYELYFSHYGLHVSLLILLLPFAIWWSRARLAPEVRPEVTAISIATLLLVTLNLLMGLRPYGSFAFIPRFLLFALPVLLLWTWCPLTRYLGMRRWSSWIPLAASLAIPIVYMGITVQKDGFTPYRYVERLWLHPEQRRAIYHTDWRAEQVVDRAARPNATIATDSGYDGWTYPLFGARLSRHVEVIPDGDGPYVPGPEVEWVAIDHAFPIIWGNANFQSMSQASRYLGRGQLSEKDLRVYRSLVGNREFELVYFVPSLFQAVFHRIRSTSAPGAPWSKR